MEYGQPFKRMAEIENLGLEIAEMAGALMPSSAWMTFFARMAL